MTSRVGPVRRPPGGLAALLRCPECNSRDLLDITPTSEDLGWWARMQCRCCDHRWVARS